MGLIIHVLISAALLWVLGQMASGIEVRDGKAALFGAIMLGLANAFVRPLLILLTLPVTLVTLGLFILVVNAVVLMIAAALVDGFEVEGFGSALWGSLLLALMNMLAGRFLGT
jgi:putative membrane protein